MDAIGTDADEPAFQLFKNCRFAFYEHRSCFLIFCLWPTFDDIFGGLFQCKANQTTKSMKKSLGRRRMNHFNRNYRKFVCIHVFFWTAKSTNLQRRLYISSKMGCDCGKYLYNFIVCWMSNASNAACAI